MSDRFVGLFDLHSPCPHALRDHEARLFAVR